VIVFDLRCAASGHVFEAWFGSTGDYEASAGAVWSNARFAAILR
jgi:hypothetical protein